MIIGSVTNQPASPAPINESPTKPIRPHNLFYSSNSNGQQRRLNDYLQMMLKRQRALTMNKPIVIYEVHQESGIGNVIRGYLTTLVISSLSNKGMQST